MPEKDKVQVSIILTSLHIERTLAMFIEFYYKPYNVKPMLEKLTFHQIIETCKELGILKNIGWYEPFGAIKTIRNKVAHELDYWELLNKDEIENKKVRDTVEKCEKFGQISISDMISNEVHSQVADNAGKMFKEALLAIARIGEELNKNPELLKKFFASK